jgi:transcriptional regulator with XRE-family HTH domain
MDNIFDNEELIDYVEQSISIYGTKKEFARVHGISAQYLGDFLQGRRSPGQKLLNAIGMEKVVLYRTKE